MAQASRRGARCEPAGPPSPTQAATGTTPIPTESAGTWTDDDPEDPTDEGWHYAFVIRDDCVPGERCGALHINLVDERWSGYLVFVGIDAASLIVAAEPLEEYSSSRFDGEHRLTPAGDGALRWEARDGRSELLYPWPFERLEG
jgi:hypothetical protein